MLKKDLISTIQKYYLNGKCKDVRWEIIDKSLYVDFMTDTGSMLGTLNAVCDLEDNILAIFNTDRLLSILNALDDEIQGQYKKSKDNVVAIEFSDGVSKVYFTTGELKKVPDPKGKLESFRDRGRQLKTDIDPAYQVKLDKDSIVRFLKSKKALSDASVVALIQGETTIDFVVNYSKHNENRITVPFPAEIKNDTEIFTYDIDLLSTMLSINDNFREGSMIISVNGLMAMEFKSEDYIVKYFLNPIEK